MLLTARAMLRMLRPLFVLFAALLSQPPPLHLHPPNGSRLFPRWRLESDYWCSPLHLHNNKSCLAHYHIREMLACLQYLYWTFYAAWLSGGRALTVEGRRTPSPGRGTNQHAQKPHKHNGPCMYYEHKNRETTVILLSNHVTFTKVSPPS